MLDEKINNLKLAFECSMQLTKNLSDSLKRMREDVNVSEKVFSKMLEAHDGLRADFFPKVVKGEDIEIDNAREATMAKLCEMQEAMAAMATKDQVNVMVTRVQTMVTRVAGANARMDELEKELTCELCTYG